MLNPFPIQWLALFAYAILRVCVGGILIYLGMRHLRHRKSLREALQLSWWPFGTFSTLTLVSAELILGTLFILGAHTQYAALALFLLSLKFLVLRPHLNHPSLPPRIFYLLLAGVSLSLLITGAGVLAIDLPL